MSEKEELIARHETHIARAKLAKQLLENPLVPEFIAMMKGNIYMELENSKWFQHKKRESLYRELKTVVNFEKLIQNTFAEGGRSLKTLEMLSKKSKIRSVK